MIRTKKKSYRQSSQSSSRSSIGDSDRSMSQGESQLLVAPKKSKRPLNDASDDKEGLPKPRPMLSEIEEETKSDRPSDKSKSEQRQSLNKSQNVSEKQDEVDRSLFNVLDNIDVKDPSIRSKREDNEESKSISSRPSLRQSDYDRLDQIQLQENRPDSNRSIFNEKE